MDTSAHIEGQLAEWPSKNRLAEILREAGLQVYVGSYSIRVNNCSHFVFQEYGGDLGSPSIDADADSPEEMWHDAQLVSNALAKAGLRHRFEIYDHANRMFASLNHDWHLESPA